MQRARWHDTNQEVDSCIRDFTRKPIGFIAGDFMKSLAGSGLRKEVTRFAERLIKSGNDLAVFSSLSDNQRYHLTALLTVDKNFSRGLFRLAD